MSQRLRDAFAAALCACALGLSAPALTSADDDLPPLDPSILDQAWQRAKTAFYDPKYHGVDWDAVLLRYRPRAQAALTQREVRDIVTEMLGELKASHTELFEPLYMKRFFEDGPKQAPVPQFGMTLTRLPGGFFVSRILPGSSAAAAGVRRGDRLVGVDRRPPLAERLFPLPYEAGLGGPRSYLVPCEQGTVVALEFERTPTPLGRYSVSLRAHGWNETEAAWVGRRVIEVDGLRFGYVQIYHLLGYAALSMTHDLLVRNPDLDGMIVDLRGRGGMPEVADKLVALFDRSRVGERSRDPSGAMFSKPCVALIDSGTRSAKEMIAFEWRRRRIGALVGQTTRGAFLGVDTASGFMKLSDGSILVIPGVDTRALSGGVDIEGEGVPPDVAVEDPLPYANGADPIFEQGVRTLRDLVQASKRRAGAWH